MARAIVPTENFYGPWPNSGEIDIMEHVGYAPDVIYAGAHCRAANHRSGETAKTATATVTDAHATFRVYAVDWEPTKITWFVDGAPFFQINKGTTDDWQQWPFDRPFHLILNVAVGGNWAAAHGIDTDTFPTTFEIDYVRVFQKKKDTAAGPPPPEADATDEASPSSAPAQADGASSIAPPAPVVVATERGPLPPPPSAMEESRPEETGVISSAPGDNNDESSRSSGDAPPPPPPPTMVDGGEPLKGAPPL